MITAFRWDYNKNLKLIAERNISFEDVIEAFTDNRILNIEKHHNEARYPEQMIVIVEIDGYAYLVPFTYEDENTIFLKTIIPSRKASKKYLGGTS